MLACKEELLVQEKHLANELSTHQSTTTVAASSTSARLEREYWQRLRIAVHRFVQMIHVQGSDTDWNAVQTFKTTPRRPTATPARPPRKDTTALEAPKTLQVRWPVTYLD